MTSSAAPPSDDTICTVSLTLVRPGRDGPEVFWARRNPDRGFLGGFHAFFAGGVESSDADLPVDTPTVEEASLRAAALRECFEECGALFTTDGLSHLPNDARFLEEAISPDEPLAASRLDCFGWWRTPEWMSPGFTTVFYGLVLTEEEGRRLDDLCDHLDPGEFDSGLWITPADALRRWKRARALTTTPLRAVLEGLDALSNDTSSLPRIPALGPSAKSPGTSQSSEICGGVTLIPVHTPTLPPATHTSAVVVGGDEFAVIDPGAPDPDALRPLTDDLQRRLDAGHRCVAIALTHHHRDHVGGIDAVADLVDAPLFAHAATLKRIDEPPLPTRRLDDGDELPVDHRAPINALHTPGHAPGHLAFHILPVEGEEPPAYDVLIAGDLVASRGTILVNPPEGHMGDYLASLRRIRELDPSFLIPAHGPPVADPRALVDHYLEHRQMREEKVLDALREMGPATPAELVPHAYDDAPQSVWPLAERSLLAHLHHLVEEGLAHQKDDHFEAR